MLWQLCSHAVDIHAALFLLSWIWARRLVMNQKMDLGFPFGLPLKIAKGTPCGSLYSFFCSAKGLANL